jgi:hypothetical protein
MFGTIHTTSSRSKDVSLIDCVNFFEHFVSAFIDSRGRVLKEFGEVGLHLIPSLFMDYELVQPVKRLRTRPGAVAFVGRCNALTASHDARSMQSLRVQAGPMSENVIQISDIQYPARYQHSLSKNAPSPIPHAAGGFAQTQLANQILSGAGRYP